jgi:putative transcriptional regulator
MKEVKFTLDPANPPQLSPTDRVRLDAMDNAAITAAASADADNPPLDEHELERVTAAGFIRETRERTGMSQPVFAEQYKLSVGRLRDLEQGRTYDGAMVAYFAVIRQEASYVANVLNTTLPPYRKRVHG